jgi:hypothetical protein
MHYYDPFLAFCLSVTIFSLAGKIYGMPAICIRNLCIFNI